MKIQIFEPGKGLYEREAFPDWRARIGIGNANNVLVKAGSDVLVREDGTIDRETIHGLLEQMVSLVREGRRVTYFTSGARAAGEDYVGERASNMSARTLCTVGQARLMKIYGEIADTWRDVVIGQGLIQDRDFQEGYRGRE